MAGPSDENKLAQELLLQMKDYTPTVRLLCLPSTPHTPRAAMVKKIKMPVLCCRPSPSANHPWLPRPAHQIPDEVTQYFLTLSGFQCPDERVTRLVSLATHKFVADLTNDALQHCKMRQQAKGGQGGRAARAHDRRPRGELKGVRHLAAETHLLRRHTRPGRQLRPTAADRRAAVTRGEQPRDGGRSSVCAFQPSRRRV